MASVSIPVVAAVGADAAGTAAAGGAAAAGTGAALTAATAADVAATSATALAATAAPIFTPIAGSLLTAANVSAGVGALGSAVSAYGQHQAGVATANMDAQKARVEQISAGQKQIAMRQNLLRSLGAQNAGTLGAVGTGLPSGFGANAMRQITQNQNDLAANSADESAQVSLLDQAGSNAEATGNLGAAGAAINGASGFAKNFNFGGS